MKEQKTVAEIMKAKHDDAVKSVTDLLWADADGDKIAAAAISGGLTVEKVQELEGYVANAKAQLGTLNAFDVAKLKADAVSANSVFEKIDIEFNKVRTQRNDAARAKDSAAAALHEAQQAYTELANQVECGELPADRAPVTVNQILVRRKAGDAVSNLEQKHKQLIRLKNDNEQIVENYQRQVDKIGTGGTRDNVSISSAGLVDEGDLIQQRMQKAVEEQRSVEKAIAKCEQDITAAVKSYERLPSPFEIPKTKEQQNG